MSNDISFNCARDKVQAYLRDLSSAEDYDLAIIDEATIEGSFGWVFFYDSDRFLATRNIVDKVVGNGPVLISKEDGALHRTGSAFPVEYYIENFVRYGKCIPSD